MEALTYDFSGWATRNDLVCADGRTIRKDAFKHCDGKTVPLVWNHRHDEPANILGYALLENRPEGVYTYCSFNDTESGRAAKELVQHGDVESLSIYANGLKQTPARDVMWGDIKEVSLVVAGANPGAFIDFVDMSHSEEGAEEEVIIGTGEMIVMKHADTEEPEQKKAAKEETLEDVFNTLTAKQKDAVYAMLSMALADGAEEEEDPEKTVKHADTEEPEQKKAPKEETLEDVFNTLTDKQKEVVYAIIGLALEDAKNEDDKLEGGKKSMKHNVFENEENRDAVLSHSDCQDILELAKSKSVGSLRTAIDIFAEQNELAHGIDNIDRLFPDYKDVRPGAPERITRDLGWVSVVMDKTHKSPFGRIRTRQVDSRVDGRRGKGYVKGAEKSLAANQKALARTTDPQTVYIKDSLHRDDILDITDFDVVEYKYQDMRDVLNEELALAIMIGDGRDPSDPDKISEDHIRSIWHDNELYTIHYDVDIDTARSTMNGTGTATVFGDNYIYAESIITAALFAREKYKGTGTPDFFCTPHLLNVMLLARDMNGRRLYTSKSDLAAALNAKEIHTAEQFEGLTRVDSDGDKHLLLGIFVNLADYTIGAVKGGELTRFNQFDIDVNQEKYLIETRCSGALNRVYAAVALEEPVENP